MFEGMTIGQLYNQFGLSCTRSTGLHDKLTIPILKQWLALDKERKHIDLKLGRKYDPNLERFGAPRIYFFNTCENIKTEIGKYMGEDKDDHLIATCKWICSLDPTYQGDYKQVESGGEAVIPLSRNSITGY